MTIELTPKELSHLKIVVRAEYFTMQSDLEELELDVSPTRNYGAG